MSCAQTAFVLVFATAGAVTAMAADAPAAARGNAAVRPAILAPTPPAPVPASPAPTIARAMTSGTAAKLAVVAPKFESAAKAVAAAPAEKPAEPIDLRDIDKPRNTIIRLPDYLVREKKEAVPVLKERDVLTPKGRLEAGYKKNPGLHLGSFWIFSNDAIAMAMQAEDERLERKREFEELTSLLQFSDPATHAVAKREVERAFLREPDFGR